MKAGLNMADELFDELCVLIEHIKEEKPDDRSEIDRRFAIIITDLEKVHAYFSVYLILNESE